ncbi:hypothetical protein Q2T42_26665 [Leptolyngbya boryana CZ1]|jgi:hypothetical protein|uniref:Uncharacterized protein n=2 Tax=Leptolyngbya boryana TaxID=1184 RepID=A0A1Z4JG38_LEPBY|nr:MULTISPECIES: hypothetical protein [Leptolyngbya]BAY55745.1 hypothetical protein NIES2135_25690 [Leptolyngbya boryana NIES-2135]MBD2370361.1 hypothetical protein [Leptolyngbya sp. FACHB-161]MBD2376705.1 hypothetical protein [Leptolyngbya sp. FACHB-238]MBD2400975.1 hypothetical protein [Leptolyngbya sp. FACHB-239]MBD2407623.1 hypothetical protein [Leptolyngbya sp. FACHB-402]
MKPFPEDDEDLTQFLQRHRSNPPPPALGLEDQIIQSLPRSSARSRSLIFLVTGIAACLLATVITRPGQTPYPVADADEIESFMTSNWSSVVEGASINDMPDYLALVEPNLNE